MTTSGPAAPSPGYGWFAKGLHWLIAALLAAQFAIAWTMPEIHRGTRPDGLIAWHLSVGALLLLLVVVRLACRLAYPVPLAEAGPAWQRHAARAVHALLYLVLVVLALMGWANASARGYAVSIAGVVPLPQLVPTDQPFGRALGDVHTLTAYVLLAIVGLHVAAALYHHVLLRDGVLRRMLP